MKKYPNFIKKEISEKSVNWKRMAQENCHIKVVKHSPKKVNFKTVKGGFLMIRMPIVKKYKAVSPGKIEYIYVSTLSSLWLVNSNV